MCFAEPATTLTSKSFEEKSVISSQSRWNRNKKKTPSRRTGHDQMINMDEEDTQHNERESSTTNRPNHSKGKMETNRKRRNRKDKSLHD